jgi:predicted Zn-dependent protease
MNPVARRRPPFSLLILAVAGGLLATWIQDRDPVSAAGVESFSLMRPCPEVREDDCDVTARARAVPEVVLNAAEVCGDVGYLCAEVEKNGSHQILRWPDGTRQLRIRVPLPQGVEPQRARELQSAAVRGIQYWQRRPFELVIDTHPTALERADIEVSWGGLGGSQLGLTRIGWTEGSNPKFGVESLALAIQSPGGRSYERPAEGVLLTAAHEMGHALGLPHSDSERDVMYPTNTARSLTTRDFRTLDALYRLPFLARIKKDQ